MKRTKNPFVFYSRLNLFELTGITAKNVPELLKHLRSVPDSCIYQHTHHFIQQRQYLSPEPPNDFAYWTSEILGDKYLGEEIASIDIMSLSTIKAIRDALVSTIERALASRPALKQMKAPLGQGFAFLKSVSFAFKTPYIAHTLSEFAAGLKKVTLNSIHYHMFEARLRIGKTTNDFSLWLADQLKLDKLANRIAKLDPYSQTDERLRATILKLIEDELKRTKKKR